MKNLIDLRIKDGKSKKDMAALLGISVDEYSQFESDKKEASYAILTKLSDYFGVTINDIIIDHDEEDRCIVKEVTEDEIRFIESVRELGRVKGTEVQYAYMRLLKAYAKSL